jgi:hypothetical protein
VATNLKEIVNQHLRYEVVMLFSIHNRLTDGVPDNVVHTALVEAFCIHVRLLNDFLCSTGNGVHAKDVTTGYEPAIEGIDKTIIKDINEQVAHLGKRRTGASELVGHAARLKLVKALAKELTVLHQDWRPQYAAPWYVEAVDCGYALHRPGRPVIVLRLK